LKGSLRAAGEGEAGMGKLEAMARRRVFDQSRDFVQKRHSFYA
jgi:hypothetical protein